MPNCNEPDLDNNGDVIWPSFKEGDIVRHISLPGTLYTITDIDHTYGGSWFYVLNDHLEACDSDLILHIDPRKAGGGVKRRSKKRRSKISSKRSSKRRSKKRRSKRR